MIEFITKYNEILPWAVPSGLILIVTLVQWAYGWRRLIDKITAALEHKVDKEDCLKSCGDKVTEAVFVETRRACVQTVLGEIEKQRTALAEDIDTVQREIAPLWRSHNALAKEVAGSTGKLDEAVDTLKEAVKEIRTANGRSS